MAVNSPRRQTTIPAILLLAAGLVALAPAARATPPATPPATQPATQPAKPTAPEQDEERAQALVAEGLDHARA